MQAPIRVLYVDDESDLLELAKLFLEQSGDFIVTTAISAADGIRFLEQDKFDSIISDYQMPGMDGIQFLVEVRTHFGLIPFILFTGRGREEVVIQAINSGADFYLQKGGEPKSQFAELAHKIKQATSRRMAEESLRKSEEEYRQIVDTAEEGIWLLDDHFRITYANRRMAEMLGYTIEEMMGKEIRSFMPKGELANYSFRTKRQQEGTPDHFERQFMCKNGSILWTSVSVTPVKDANGNFRGSFAMYSDITERKRVEEELREVNKKLTLLSSITRHDINNQLALLMGHLKILEKKLSNPALTENFQKVVTSAQRISVMIQFTTEYEQIGVKAPVWQHIHALADNASKDIPHENVRVKNDLPAGAEVFADSLIARVFHNLLDNAVRYGGKITTIRFFLEEIGGDPVIVCEDDGDGIPAREKGNIFLRGFGRNTGLGLFLSREILAITGIRITETGVPGKGARFEMTVPKGAYRLGDTGRM